MMDSLPGSHGRVDYQQGRRELIFVVEASTSLQPHWPRIKDHYIPNIIKCFHKDNATAWLGLVVFASRHGSLSVQRSAWTTAVPLFLTWLEDICFRLCNDMATAEGLAEALMMFNTIVTHENTARQSRDYYQKHCILVASTFPVDGAVEILKLPSKSNGPAFSTMQKLFYNAQDVAKHFAQCFVSLSVISPRRDLLFNKIFNKAKPNTGSVDAGLENVDNPDEFLILLSKHFLEAHVALNPSGVGILPMNQGLLIDKTSRLSLSESLVSFNLPGNTSDFRTSRTSGNTSVPVVKVEPSIVPFDLPIHGTSQGGLSVASLLPDHPSQDSTFDNDHLLGFKPVISEMPISNDCIGQFLPLPLQNTSFSKVWEGSLSGEIRDRHVHIRLEAYRGADTSETIAHGWPSTMEIVFSVFFSVVDKFVFASAFVKEYVGKVDIVYFHKLDQPELFYHFNFRKMWQFIQLPSQILLLCMTRDDDCWGGLLFPPDMEDPMNELIKEFGYHQQLQRSKGRLI